MGREFCSLYLSAGRVHCHFGSGRDDMPQKRKYGVDRKQLAWGHAAGRPGHPSNSRCSWCWPEGLSLPEGASVLPAFLLS